MNPHDPVSFPTDPYPVRPGTSAVLTARTIDATPQPPLVQAQETVAALIPRLTAPLSSPLFVTTLAGTLVLVWLAMRMKTRLVPVLLSAMLMMTLTSFRPARGLDEAQIVDDGAEVVHEEAVEDEDSERFEQHEAEPPTPEPTPFVFRIPIRPEKLPNVEKIRQDEEELREAIEELRLRIEEELRRRGERPYRDGDRQREALPLYQTRSARWIRRIAPSVQEWVVDSRHGVAHWDRDR